jgi:hypothetical protein
MDTTAVVLIVILTILLCLSLSFISIGIWMGSRIVGNISLKKDSYDRFYYEVAIPRDKIKRIEECDHITLKVIKET